MIAVVCIDNKNGMTFNRRRQSRDSKLIEDLMRLTGEKQIRMKEYSRSLFEDYPDRISVSDTYLQGAEDDDICFVETDDLLPFAEKIQGLIVYRWNRHYPSSTKFTLDLGNYHLTRTEEFSGSSHDTITREEYER